MRSLFIICLLIIATRISAQKELSFTSLDSLFIYAEKNSATIQTSDKQSLLAKTTKLAALGNTVNLRCPISASYIDNTELPVSYVPTEFFGGPAGGTKELTLGQEYVTNYAITPQIDIINPGNWVKVKSASVNVALTEVTNLVNKKALYENISATWFNITSLQEQIEAVNGSVKSADSLAGIAANKFAQGIIREQDKNNLQINALTMHERENQLKILLQQQYGNLKVLCDIPSATTVTVKDQKNITAAPLSVSANNLTEKQLELQANYLKSELRSNRTMLLAPTVSFIFNQGWQENSNKQFFDPDANKFSTQYYGLKVSIPFPLEVTRLSQSYTSKINYQIAEINRKHAALATQNNNEQLILNYNSANSTYTTNKQIAELKEKNYHMSLNQYNEGILSTELLLNSFTDHTNAKMNEISARAGLRLAETKIEINNRMQ